MTRKDARKSSTTERLKAYRLERTARGLCLYCPAPPTRGRACELCAEKILERCKRRYREMRLAGECVKCGVRAAEGRAMCAECSTENLTRTKKAKRMKILKARGKR